MAWLPVRCQTVNLASPGGTEQLLLIESAEPDRGLALRLLERLCDLGDVAALTLHDFEALLLQLRAMLLGDAIDADTSCICGERVDVAFSIAAFLDYRKPRHPRHVAPADADGWHTTDEAAAFRLPSVADQIAVAEEPRPAQSLALRCIRGKPKLGRVQSAMAAMAPALSGPIAGDCPYCGRQLSLLFDVPSFVMHELRLQSAGLLEDIHLLASQYGWSEPQILALPPRRRQYYAELVASDRWGAA